MKIHLTTLLLLLAAAAMSQKKVLNRELMVENDNDAYTLNLTRDQYYSNGVALRYRILTDSGKWKDSFEKVIRSYHINHRVYSPKRIWWEDSADMDRPFAGQLSLAISNEYYFKKSSYLKAKLELGWMGPALKTGKLQYRWHKAFGMTLPRGWRFQINDAPIINLYGTWAKSWWTAKNLDLVSESNLALGTSFTHARQELMVRFGTFRPIHRSTQYNALVGTKNDKSGIKEFYFFISPGLEFVGYNATIEGNFLGKETSYIEASEKWVYQTRAGIMASWTKFDFALLYYRRTKETPEAIFHKYVGIRMNQRF